MYLQILIQKLYVHCTYGYRMTTLDSRLPYCINSHKNNHMSTCVHGAKTKKGDHR